MKTAPDLPRIDSALDQARGEHANAQSRRKALQELADRARVERPRLAVAREQTRTFRDALAVEIRIDPSRKADHADAVAAWDRANAEWSALEDTVEAVAEKLRSAIEHEQAAGRLLAIREAIAYAAERADLAESCDRALQAFLTEFREYRAYAASFESRLAIAGVRGLKASVSDAPLRHAFMRAGIDGVIARIPAASPLRSERFTFADSDRAMWEREIEPQLARLEAEAIAAKTLSTVPAPTTAERRELVS